MSVESEDPGSPDADASPREDGNGRSSGLREQANERDRLGGLDTALLEMGSKHRPMHLGSLFIFDPAETGVAEGATFSRFSRLVRSRLHLVPRYRQKLRFAPWRVGPPVWVDDSQFDLAYHVRHAALPAPGTTPQLTEYAARILSRPLDPTRPLWELYAIEGLEQGRIALLSKQHPALVDGVTGIDLVSVLFDSSPDQSREIPPPEPWHPAPEPTDGQLAAEQAVRLATSPQEMISSIRRLARAPLHSVSRVTQVGRGLARVVRSNLMQPAPRSILNRPPGPHRRFAIQRVSVDDVRVIKSVFDTTVNDVVLAVIADALGRYLRQHSVRTDRLWLRSLVPISTRDGSDTHLLGNRVVSTFVDLPMFALDPIERLQICRDQMSEVRATHAAVGANYLIGLADFAPPTLHAMASRLAVTDRLFNFLVVNVPGPQQPRYCLGARLLGAFPFTPLGANHAFAVGVISIEGWLNFGFTADYDALPDVEVLCDHLVAAVGDLLSSAEAAGEKTARLRGEQRTGTQADVITSPGL